jgi:hypothetical protein
LIKRIEISSIYSNAPDLPLSSLFVPNDDPVQIRNVEGLGPVKADISATPFATGRGELYQGSSTGKRNIVLTLGLNPNWVNQTMASLRQLLYRYFMVESWATLRFFTDDHPVTHITGIVESFEPNMFSQDPEMQISILCPKPDFVDVDTTLIRGLVDSGTEVSLNYDGTSPTGFELRILTTPGVTSANGDFTVINVAAGSFKEFHLIAAEVNNSMFIELNTVRSTRHVYNVMLPDQPIKQEINILAKMGKTSDWPELLPGGNLFSVGSSAAGLRWILAYFNRYGGL